MSQQIIGRYKINTELGRGGMATVYHAHDPNFDRAVAVKVLPREFLHDPQFRERFEREARTIAGLEHPAIVPVHDYGEDEGLLYLVMRYMTGGSLEDRIKESAIPLQEAAHILTRLASALDEAHMRGIVHRDLKPANILFDQHNDPYLSDFGIAKLAEAGGSLTGTGIIGTPAYMSPEQARGERDIDGRSDIYSLGVIVFEMLTGQAPYESDTPMGVAVKHILDPIPDILEVKPDLPPETDSVIKRALAKDREARYLTATNLATALSTVASGEHLPESLRATGAESDVTIPMATPAPTQQVGGAVTRPSRSTEPLAAHERHEKHKRGGGCFLWGCLLPVGLIGAVFLGSFFAFRSVTLDMLSGIPGVPPEILHQFAAEDVELSGEMVSHPIEQELAAGITELDVRIDIIQANVEVGTLDGSEARVIGEYRTDEALEPVSLDYDPRLTRAILTVEQPEHSFGAEGNELDIDLPGNIQIDLTVNNDFGDVILDLTDLNLRSLTVEGGAGKLHIKLPEQGNLAISITGGAGEVIIEAPEDVSRLVVREMTVDGGFGAFSIELPANGDYAVKINVGFGSAAIKVPDGLEARVVYAGELTLLNDRFTQIDSKTWETAAYEGGADRALIEVQGMGSIRVED